MRILHVLLTLRDGGIQNFLLSLAPMQVKMGNEVIIMVIDKESNEYSVQQKKKLEDNNIYVYSLNRIVGDKVSSFKTILKARRLIKEIKPDIINSHASICHVISSLSSLGMKTIHCCTIHSAPEEWTLLTKILNFKKPLIYCSDSALKLRGQNGEPMIAINNGIDIDNIRTNHVVNLHNELNIPPNDKIVVLVGSARPPKNYPFLIRIVEKLQDSNIHFCICGGSYKVPQKTSSNNNFISLEQFNNYKNIHLLGTRNDIPAILNGANVYLSCSIKEGLPISALEAFVMGIPCVLSPILQHTSIAEGVSECYIPKAFDEQSFIDALNDALKCNIGHDSIFKNRKSILQKFSIERCAREYIDFYQQLLNK